jgi:hypothetical protein
MGIFIDLMRRLVDELRLGYVAISYPDGICNLSRKGSTAV